MCDKCIIIFSEQIFDYMLKTYAHEQAGTIKCCNGITKVYVFEIDNMKIAAYLSHIGSSMAGSDVIDANWLTDASRFIMFGLAGSLDSDKTTGKFVIPIESYREEGMSYHYAEPSNYIKIRNYQIVKFIFDNLGLPNVAGKVWTTDAIYRETKAKLDARKKEGCIAVEMELAGVQAFCDFYGWIYMIFWLRAMCWIRQFMMQLGWRQQIMTWTNYISQLNLPREFDTLIFIDESSSKILFIDRKIRQFVNKRVAICKKQSHNIYIIFGRVSYEK